MPRIAPQDWVGLVLAAEVKKDPESIGLLPAKPPTEVAFERLKSLRDSFQRMSYVLGFHAEVRIHEKRQGYVCSPTLLAEESTYLIRKIIALNLLAGIDLRPVFAEVHRAEMKLELIDGVLQGPPDWVPPDIKAALDSQPPLRTSPQDVPVAKKAVERE